MRKNYQTLGWIFGDKKKLDYELTNHGYGAPKLKEGFSFDKAYQDQKPAGSIPFIQTRGAGDGRQTRRGSTAYYAKEAPPKPAAKPAPKPAPAPAPAPPAISDESKQYRADTLKILQQADERMKAFEAQRAADEAARVKREEIAAQSAAARSANQMRAGQAPNLQLQPASQAPTTGGTQPFKRRKMQFGGSSPYLSLAISSQL